MKRVLVTGATGFVGGHVARALARDPALSVMATGRRRDSDTLGCYLPGDLASDGFASSLFAEQGFDAVVHLAALVTKRLDPDVLPSLVHANVLATANLAAAAASSGCSRFIYCSSIAVYGRAGDGVSEIDESLPARPTTPYGWSKLAGEQVARLAGDVGMSVACLRLAGVHGPRRDSGAVSAMLRAAMAGAPITVDEPLSRFRLLFVDDVVRAIRAALDRDAPLAGVFNLAGAEAMTLTEMAEGIGAIVGSGSAIDLRAQDRPPRSEVLATGRFRDATGFTPAPFEAHVRRMIEGLRP